MPLKWFKATNSKITHLKFYSFFRQSVAKSMGKAAIWTIFWFYPLLPLNIVETQWTKLASSYVMGLQYCKRAKARF